MTKSQVTLMLQVRGPSVTTSVPWNKSGHIFLSLRESVSHWTSLGKYQEKERQPQGGQNDIY